MLDTMSRHGTGPMLLWPFSTATYEFPWRPIPGVESATLYFSVQAIPTFLVETLLTLPISLYAATRFLRAEPIDSPDLVPQED